MSYQDELREQAQKRAKRNHRTKMIMLIVFLIVVFYIIHFLGKQSEQIETKKIQIKSKTTQEQSLPSTNETK